MPKRPGKEVQCNKMPLIRGSFTPQTYAGRIRPVKLRADAGTSSEVFQRSFAQSSGTSIGVACRQLTIDRLAPRKTIN